MRDLVGSRAKSLENQGKFSRGDHDDNGSLARRSCIYGKLHRRVNSLCREMREVKTISQRESEPSLYYFEALACKTWKEGQLVEKEGPVDENTLCRQHLRFQFCDLKASVDENTLCRQHLRFQFCDLKASVADVKD